MLILLWPRPPENIEIVYYFHQDTNTSAYTSSEQQKAAKYTVQDGNLRIEYRRLDQTP
jgi:hypothetical protein